jgi:hypothetical protein
MEANAYPLILVFYLDRGLMANPDIMGPFSDHINNVIAQRGANIMSFFMPTDGEERIECINPLTVSPTKMSEINAMVEQIAAQFDIGQGADEGKNDPENEVETDGEIDG